MKGLIDLHLHGMPSLVRRLNPWDYVKEMDQAGYRACLIQDHSASTAGLVYALNHGPEKWNMDIFGTLVMNSAAGGIQVACVEAAHRMGVRRISFPTTSSPRQEAYLKENNLTFGGGSLKTKEPQVTPLNEKGTLTEEAKEVLDYVSQNPELILSTGYMAPEEIDVVVSGALDMGIRKILIDHPYMIVQAPMEKIKEWAERGAYIEFEATSMKGIATTGDLTPDGLKEMLEQLPADKIVLSSDLGQLKNGSPVTGYRRFLEMVSEMGFAEADVQRMVVGNAEELLYR